MSNSNNKKNNSTKLATSLFSIILIIVVAVGAWYFLSDSPSSSNTQLSAEPTQTMLAEETSKTKTPKPSSSPATTAKPSQGTSSNAAVSYSLKKVMPVDGNFNFIVFDIGQGDSLFIQMPNGKNMLIDTGIADYWDRLDDYLKQLGVTKIDALVATHPHSDHIGSMRKVVQNYDIGEIYMPKATHTSKTFIRLLETIEKKNYTITPLQGGKGQTINLDQNVTVEVVGPMGDNYESLNDYSAVFHITYGDTTFLLTGDAEKLSEDEMVAYYGDKLKSDVLKVPHHGSNTSSKKPFLSAVDPEYALISCEQGNQYNHPHDKTVARLEAIGAKIYRTDLVGSILASSDGKNITLTTSR